MKHSGHGKCAIHTESGGVFLDQPVQPLDGGHDVVRGLVGSLLKSVLAQVQPSSVSDVVETCHKNCVYREVVPGISSLPHPPEGDNLTPGDRLEIAVQWLLTALQVLDACLGGVGEDHILRGPWCVGCHRSDTLGGRYLTLSSACCPRLSCSGGGAPASSCSCRYR